MMLKGILALAPFLEAGRLNYGQPEVNLEPINVRLKSLQMIDNMFAARSNETNQADIEAEVNELMGSIYNYGCYCFVNSFTPGLSHTDRESQKSMIVGPLKLDDDENYAGAPVDALDALCLRLFLKQKCINADLTEFYGNLDSSYCKTYKPWQAYSKSAASSASMKEVVCGNPSEPSLALEDQVCAYHNCEVEKEFVKSVTELIKYMEFSPKSEYKDMTLEKRKQVCRAAKHENGPQKRAPLKCCGERPNRFPYNSRRLQCCDEVLKTSCSPYTL